MNQEKYYLTSTEHRDFVSVRECNFIGAIDYRGHTKGVQQGVLVKVHPGIFHEIPGKGRVELNHFVILPRHESNGLFPIKQWPVHVYVYQILNEDILKTRQINNDKDVYMLAWAELHDTYESAKKTSDQYYEMNPRESDDKEKKRFNPEY